MNSKIILASNSPRRKEIMEMLPWSFSVDAVETDETMDKNIPLEENLKNLAYQKAEKISDKYPDKIVIGADTIVFAGGKILGKPTDEKDAREMLRLISSEEHYVYTGVCILKKDSSVDIRFVEKTAITMTKMSESDIDEYISYGEYIGKAGSYAIQGKGGIYVEKIDGDFYNVVGLPLNRLYRNLKEIVDVF